MRRICMDCLADMGEAPGPEDQTSHGICPKCAPARYREPYMLVAAEMALETGRAKLAKAMAEEWPPSICASITSTAEDIAEALRSYQPAVTKNRLELDSEGDDA